MLFNSIIAASILAYTASALPQMLPRQSNDTVAISAANTTITSEIVPLSTPTGASNGTPESADPPKATTTAPVAVELSLTQRLTIADTAVDRFALLPENDDFVFDFAAASRNAPQGKAGQIVAANRKNFPALVGTGSGMAVGFMDACGFNTPHVHPRATELQVVVEGRIITEMLPENNVNTPDGKRRVIRNELGPFQVQPFYQGSVHTQYNPECYPATFIASFNAEDFGAGSIPDELTAFDTDIVTAAFGQSVSGQDVERFRDAIPASIALGVQECVQRCYNPDGTLKDPKGDNNPLLRR